MKITKRLLLLLVLVIGISSLVSAVSMNTSGIVGYWSFDYTLPGMQWSDSSGFNNTAYDVDGTGNVSEGRQFFGMGRPTTYVSVNDSDSLDLSYNFTIASWIVINQTSNNAGGTILGKDEPGGRSYTMYAYNGTGGVGVQLNGGGGGAGCGLVNVSFNNGIKYYVMMSRERSNISMFVNNVNVKNCSYSTIISGTTVPLLIGTRGFFDSTFNGSVDEVLIANRALNDSERDFLYNSGLGRNPFNVTANEVISFKSFYDELYVYNFTLKVYDSSLVLVKNNFVSGNNDTFTGTPFNTYYYNISKVGFPDVFGNFTLGDADNFSYVTVYSYPFDSMIIRAYEEGDISNQIVNFTANFYGTSNNFFLVNNSNFTNGVLYVKNLSRSVLNVIVNSSGYTSRGYIVDMSGGVAGYGLNAFLANDTKQVVIVVRNSANTVLSGALVTFFSTDGLGNSVVVGSGLTDVSGQVSFNLLGSRTYSFSVVASGYSTKFNVLQPVGSEYTFFVDSNFITPTQAIAGNNYVLSVIPTYSFYNLSPVDFVSFNVTALSDSNSLESLKLSVKVENAADCVVGVWDGENCTSSISNSISVLNTSVRVATWYNPRLDLNVFTKVSGFVPDVQTFYYSSNPLVGYGQAENRSIQVGLREALDKSSYGVWTKVAILFGVAVLVGLFLFSVGLPQLLIVLLVLGGFFVTTWVVIDDFGVRMILSVVGIMMAIMVMRSGA